MQTYPIAEPVSVSSGWPSFPVSILTASALIELEPNSDSSDMERWRSTIVMLIVSVDL